ncbi:MAG: hypothetical protein ABSH10_01455 [Phycisphaerae bacterium]
MRKFMCGSIAAACLSMAALLGASPPAAPQVGKAELYRRADLIAKALIRYLGAGYTYRIDFPRHLVYVYVQDKSTVQLVIAKTLETYADAEQAMLFHSPLQWNVAILIPKLEDFRRIAPQADTTAGIYFPAAKVLLTSSVSSSLIHEFTHALHDNDQALANQEHPTWLVEGLAVLFQQSRPALHSTLQIEAGYRVALAKMIVQEGCALPLAELLRKDHAQFMQQAEICYPQAGALLYYLYSLGKLSTFYDTYKANYGKDRTGELALTTVLGKDLKDIETDWQQWMTDLQISKPMIGVVAYLGAGVKPAANGVQVTGFSRWSPAGREGKICVDDVILSLAGQATPTPEAFQNALLSCPSRSIVEIQLSRYGKKVVIQQLLGAAPVKEIDLSHNSEAATALHKLTSATQPAAAP